MTEQLDKRECNRCGICCEKGGPALHTDDIDLISKNVLSLSSLFTIRLGEPVWDNVTGHILFIDTDIIKIDHKQGSRACVYFDSGIKKCKIYNDRPQECSALRCWDTDQLESIYKENRLTRKDLLSESQDLYRLIKHHQARCDYRKLEILTDKYSQKKTVHRSQEIIAMLQYDLAIREECMSKMPMTRQILNFLFGRPMVDNMEFFDIKITKNRFGTFKVKRCKIVYKYGSMR